MMKKAFLTKNGPKAVGPYSTAVIHSDTVYLSGMIPLNPETNALVEGGIEPQTRQVFENIKTVLSEMGLTLADVIKAGVFLLDMGDFATVNQIYAEYFVPDYPARSCVQVSALPKGALIEIEITAATDR